MKNILGVVKSNKRIVKRALIATIALASLTAIGKALSGREEDEENEEFESGCESEENENIIDFPSEAK
jgi:NADH:ubiquinone oxidoreductase subunit 3 (subunit A)